LTTQSQVFAVPFHAADGHHVELRTRWLAQAGAPRLHVRGVHLRRAVTSTAVTLPFNARGIGSAPGDGSLDNVGSVLDAALVGTALDVGFQHFVFGQAGNNVLAGGAGEVTVASGSYASLELIGFAVNGDQLDQSFTVAYTDGSSQVIARSLSDWIAAQPKADERIAECMPYRWSVTAKEYGNFHLFQYSLPLDATRTLRAFTPPPNANVKLLAATLNSP
jgi:hypothetical protein